MESLSLGPSASTSSSSKKIKKVKKQPPPGGWPKKKKLTKAERRALQEQQRRAKGLAPSAKSAAKSASSSSPSLKSKSSVSSSSSSSESFSASSIFSHLAAHRYVSSKGLGVRFGRPTPGDLVHPEIARCGLRMGGEGGALTDSNDRCASMLSALKCFTSDFDASSDALSKRENFWQTMDRHLKIQISFLAACRPLAFSMRNAIGRLRRYLPRCGDVNAVSTWIDRFLKENVRAAGDEIAMVALRKIADGDVVATYAYDSTVERVLVKAHESGRRFRVLVVDGRPHLDGPSGGKRLLRRLVQCGVDCTYVRLSAVSYAMQDDVTKVLLGSEAMLSNGSAVALGGSATVAMVARACKKPVLVCCESYKFCERVLIDAIVWNELGDPEAVSKETTSPSSSSPSPHYLNILFDTIPVEFVTIVVTEAGLIPPTSVPVVIRERDAAVLF